MNYRSVANLQEATRQMAEDLPADIDLVVGIPRSGLLAGNLLCLNIDVPMTDVDGLCRGDLFDTGNRYEQSLSIDDIDTVLVLDDSVYTGTQMKETQQRLDEETFPFDIEYAAVYITWDTQEYVDYWGEVVPSPRAFEWNVLHHYDLWDFCVDLDGILCRDSYSEVVTGDEPRDREVISEVDPKILPNRRIGWLVTCRPETYRAETEAWLDEHGIEYDNLVMKDRPGARTGQPHENHAAYKANVYDETDAKLFIECTHQQAIEICEQTNEPVYCYESNEMIQPGRISQVYNKGAEYHSLFREDPVEFSVSAGKYVVQQITNRLQ